MSIPEDPSQAVRWFLQTLFALRDEMNDEEFAVFRQWLEFVADDAPQAH